ncbi:MAG: hypothetical protein AABW83_03615 [Nanoarchaeota archaeon]
MSDKGAVVKSRRKISFSGVLFFLFVLVLFFLIYTSFFNPDFIQSFTGNAIKEEIFLGVPIQADLDPPENIMINSRVDKLNLKIIGAFLIDGKKYELISASLVIDNFDGDINLDNKILILNGKATKIFVEGIPITGNLKISLNNKYEYVKLNNVYISDLSYDASGIVRLENEKVTVNLEEDKFNINNFRGNLEKSNNYFRLDGMAEEISAGMINVKANNEN